MRWADRDAADQCGRFATTGRTSLREYRPYGPTDTRIALTANRDKRGILRVPSLSCIQVSILSDRDGFTRRTHYWHLQSGEYESSSCLVSMPVEQSGTGKLCQANALSHLERSGVARSRHNSRRYPQWACSSHRRRDRVSVLPHALAGVTSRRVNADVGTAVRVLSRRLRHVAF